MDMILFDIFIIFTIIQPVIFGSQCDDIYKGISNTAHSGGFCESELDTNCRIDTLLLDVSTAKKLNASLHSGFRVCFGCDGPAPVCDQIIICQSTSQCYREASGQNGEYIYGCSENYEEGICHHTFCKSNLCNGDQFTMSYINKVLDGLNNLSKPITTSVTMPPTTSLTPTTTASTTTPSTSAQPTTVGITTEMKVPTRTASATLPSVVTTQTDATSTMASNSSVYCVVGDDNSLVCKDEQNPYFNCKEWIDSDFICYWPPGVGHNLAVDRCPVSCGFCDEYCMKKKNMNVAQDANPVVLG